MQLKISEDTAIVDLLSAHGVDKARIASVLIPIPKDYYVIKKGMSVELVFSDFDGREERYLLAKLILLLDHRPVLSVAATDNGVFVVVRP